MIFRFYLLHKISTHTHPYGKLIFKSTSECLILNQLQQDFKVQHTRTIAKNSEVIYVYYVGIDLQFFCLV